MGFPSMDTFPVAAGYCTFLNTVSNIPLANAIGARPAVRIDSFLIASYSG